MRAFSLNPQVNSNKPWLFFHFQLPKKLVISGLNPQTVPIWRRDSKFSHITACCSPFESTAPTSIGGMGVSEGKKNFFFLNVWKVWVRED